MIAHIRCKALRATEKCLDANIGERRQTLNGAEKDRLEMLDILGQFVEAEIFGNTIHTPGLSLGFEGTEKKLTSVFLVVSARIIISQHRKIRGERGERLGNNIEMLTSVQRYMDAN